MIIIVSTRLIGKTQACSTVVGEAKCDYLTIKQSQAVFLLEYFVILL